MLASRLFAPLFLLPLFTNLHAIDDEGYDEDDDCSRRTQFSLLTYNTGLIPLIDKYEERRAKLPPALHQVDADVVCLQEVSYESDVRYLLKSLWWKYPYSWSFLHSSFLSLREVYSPPDTSGKSFVCDVQAYPAFGACVVTKCPGITGYPLAVCGLQKCTTEVFSLPSDCLSCIAGSVRTLDTANSLCATPGQGPEAFRKRYQPQGLLLLSRLPILRSTAKRFLYIPDIPQVYPRGLLEVQIARIGKVLCTHLTAELIFPGLSYVEVFLNQTLGISSYEEQQLDEVEKINRKYPDGSLILTGDLNTGPTVEDQGVEGQFPDNYETLVEEDYDNPYVDMDGRCTYCTLNPIAVPFKNSTIDHVLLRGYNAVSAKRVIDNEADPLSDHYGVKVTFCRD